MNTKWKIYKLICYVDVILSSVIIFFAFYGEFTRLIKGASEDDSIGGRDIVGFVMVLAIGLICFFSDLVNIKLLRKLKDNEDISDSFYVTVGMTYIFLCLFGLLIIAAIVDMISNWQASALAINYYTIVELLLVLIMLVIFLASIIKIVFTFILVKAVRKNRTAYLEGILTTIGTE